MRKDQVKLSKIKAIPALIFKPTFDNHMKLGDKSGSTHAGLHVIGEFTKDNGQTLAVRDIVRGASYQGSLSNRQTTVTIKDVDLRAKTFLADVNIYGNIKSSTFFPIGTTLVQAKNFIREAWKDHCIYGSSEYGGGDVEIYNQMRTRFRLNWVGTTKINGQKIWVGSQLQRPVPTAFPAVNNKFR